MEKLSSEKIRELWQHYWEDRSHALVKPDSLVPDSTDKTVLFTTAGMQQLVPFLMGKSHDLGKRIFNIQKCLRTVDIDEVGDERHLTFFEMMGNWSLGSYFKNEALEWTVDFLVNTIGIAKDKIGATIFMGRDDIGIGLDVDAKNILLGLGIVESKIKPLDMDDNFWGPAGEVGPCGPCCEIYVDRGDDFGSADWDLGTNDRYIEVWNNVFMEFYKDEKGDYTKLKQQNVDTGMGLERLCMIVQRKETIFETNLFDGLIGTLEKALDIGYPPYKKKNQSMSDGEKEISRRFRIIADHVRTGSFLIGDGVRPSNEGRGYVLRRLIRRMFYNMVLLKEDVDADADKLIGDLVNTLNEAYGSSRNEINTELDKIKECILLEIDQFQKTILRGKKLFHELVAKSSNNQISGHDAFLLYDTFGFPLELTKEIAESKGYSIDIDGFHKEMNVAKDKSRKATQDVFTRGTDWSKYLDGVPQTEFLGYDTTVSTACKIIKQIDGEKGKIIIFDKTPFYAESGGQTGDNGKIIFDGGETNILDTKKYAGVFLHFTDSETAIPTDSLTLQVSNQQRYAKMRAHTSAHLLNEQLDKILNGTKQEGSYVDEDYLRFDFSTSKPLTNDQLKTIETNINNIIAQSIQVDKQEMSYDDAVTKGAKAFFEDKYGDKVRVISVVSDLCKSVELCGGTHCDNTKEIGAFKITGQEAVASGIRRVVAVTGPKVGHFAIEKEQSIYQLGSLLGVPAKQISEKVNKLVQENAKLKSEAESMKGQTIINELKTIKSKNNDKFEYIINISDCKQLTNINFKEILNTAKDIYQNTNCIIFNNEGNFAILANKGDISAKKYASEKGIRGGGNDKIVQGKDGGIVGCVK